MNTKNIQFVAISQVIWQLEGITSTTQKQIHLKENESDELKEVLYYTLNPYKTYGVTNFSINYGLEEGKAKSDSWTRIKSVLDQLQLRELTGNEARQVLSQLGTQLTEIECILLSRILKKDLRCGVSTKTVNKVWKKLIPEFEVMLAETGEERIVYPCYVEPKYDGVRTIAIVRDGSVNYYSRNGKEFANFDVFSNSLIKLPDGVYDGEVVGADFNTLMTYVHRKHKEGSDIDLKYVVFDMLPLDEFESKVFTMSQRSRSIIVKHNIDSLHDEVILTPEDFYFAANKQDLDKAYRNFVAQGYEGAIVKNIKAVYESKRSKHWIKLKPVDTLDLEIVDVIEGEGKYVGTLGALVVNHKEVAVNVGTGYTDEDRNLMWKNKSSLIGKTVEVAYQEITPDGSLRFPVFKCIREDK